MAKYDVENLLADMKSILVANLNAAIDAVEAEKIAQGLPATGITHIDTSVGYFEQSLAIESLNISPAIYYGVEQINAQGMGPASAMVYKVFVEVILVDSGQDTLGLNRLHRYARAIQDVIEANYDRLPTSSSKIKIETVRPISFKLDEDSSEEMRVGGVSLTLAIA